MSFGNKIGGVVQKQLEWIKETIALLRDRSGLGQATVETDLCFYFLFLVGAKRDPRLNLRPLQSGLKRTMRCKSVDDVTQRIIDTNIAYLNHNVDSAAVLAREIFRSLEIRLPEFSSHQELLDFLVGVHRILYQSTVVA